MKVLKALSRIFLGLVFIFSGFVKAVDPLGSTYKFIDYFSAFGIDSSNSLVLVLAIILSTAEFIIGIALLFGIRMKLASWGALIFMGIFTPLTLYLAIYNPVTDCGCFGDAVKFSNWQTFGKNLVILIPCLFTFIHRRKYYTYNIAAEWFTVLLFTAGIIHVSIYSYHHLPLFDFRPYKTGVNIMESMMIPEGIPGDQYAISAVYQKNGVSKEFVYPDFPDSTWKWIETKNKLIKKGYEPPIQDFMIETLEGENITDRILEDKNFTFLLISYDLSLYDNSNQEKINRLADYSEANGYKFLCLNSASKEQIQDFMIYQGVNFSFCLTDETTLKTMIRANPGLILLYNGTIISQWHSNDIPNVNNIKGNLLSFVLSENARIKDHLLTMIIGLSLLTLLILFNLIFYRKKLVR